MAVVAIVGAGPIGLSAAQFAAKNDLKTVAFDMHESVDAQDALL